MKKNENNSKKEKAGVFVALSICLLSIGIASLGTYNSVSNYLKEQNSTVDTQNDNKENDAPIVINDKKDTDIVTVEQDEKDIDQKDDTTDESKTSSTNVDTKKEEKDNTTASQTSSDVETKKYSLSSTYSLPVESITILQGYSGDELVYNETMKDYRSHNGVDLETTNGETVHVVNNGLILDCFNDLLVGNVVSVEHGDYEVWYCGLGSTFLVEKGEVIDKGTAIGNVKEVPFEKSEKSHIHIEVREDGKLIDPLSIDFF